MMQPIIVRACQRHGPIAIALQTDVQALVRVKHGQRYLRGVEKAQPKLDARMFALLRRQGAPRPTVPGKERVFALSRHRANLRREKLPQLAISFEHVAVGIDDWKRTLHRRREEISVTRKFILVLYPPSTTA